MDKKKDLTKELLADCFHELMLSSSFDKITIKMITDRAGLIRPTFYKHFQDKYEVLEWIFKTDVEDNVDLLIENRMESEAVRMFCRCLDKDRVFYRKAYQMEPGPNSFENVLNHYIFRSLQNAARNRNISLEKQFPFISGEMLANYYTYGLAYAIRNWIVNDASTSADDFASAFIYLLTHSLKDLISSNK